MKTQMTPTHTIETHRLDATQMPLGRLATQAAVFLRGKHKPSFVHHFDVGDAVIITNAAKVVLTGRKLEQKEYYRHTGWLGHLKTETAKQLMVTKPDEVIRRAIAGMMPRTRLHAGWMKRLQIFVGDEGDK